MVETSGFLEIFSLVKGTRFINFTLIMNDTKIQWITSFRQMKRKLPPIDFGLV